MLKNKLARNETTISSVVEDNSATTHCAEASPFFAVPLWRRFYDLEVELNEALNGLQPPPRPISHTYNPVEYAAQIHCAYLQRYLDGEKRLLFVGMNPGANGMGQTGVPFGNVATVRDIMQLSGDVLQPSVLHEKRPITGLECKIEEPSGVRLWGLLQRLSGGSLTTFSKQCFVHNFCPLAFFDNGGKNITPSELKGEYKSQIRDICLKTLDDQIDLLKPEIVVAVGDYVATYCMKKSRHANSVSVLKLPHPSPRSLNNHNWPEKAERIIVEEWNLLPYMQNTIPFV